MDRISRRALNRTTLGRQLLLERSSGSASETVELLVGMQAQNPTDPYYALWSRLEAFEPEELSGMVTKREVVRGQLMRATIHLLTTPDFMVLRPQFQTVCSRTLGSTVFAKDTREVDRDALLTRGRTVLEDTPMTRAELGQLLAKEWPGIPPGSLAQVVTFLLPVIQVPPRALWRQTGQAKWTTIESWAGEQLAPGYPLEQTVLRYLAAFGPASITDMRVWSGLPGLRGVVDGMRSRLRVYEDEGGDELLDLPEAPILDEETPAPPRFLPEYDNLLLGHADRSRFFVPGVVPEGWAGNLLADGLFSGSWKVSRSKDRAQVEVNLFRTIPKRVLQAVGEEAERLLGFTDPDLREHKVVLHARATDH